MLPRIAHLLAWTAPMVGSSACSSAWVELGAGLDHYERLRTGDEVAIVRGPQGGYMIALAARAGGIEGGDPADPTGLTNPLTTFRAALADSGEEIAETTVALGLDDEDGELELFGMWLIFDEDVDPADYWNVDLVLSVRVVDADEREARDRRRVFARWDDPSLERR